VPSTLPIWTAQASIYQGPRYTYLIPIRAALDLAQQGNFPQQCEDDTSCNLGEHCCSGVCTDTTSDPRHCGLADCGVACDTFTQACCLGNCDWINGKNNGPCGSCNDICGVGQECCLFILDEGYHCVSVQTDPFHCGSGCANKQCNIPDQDCCQGSCQPLGTNVNCAACGNTCTNGMICIHGTCTCPSGEANCSGTCQPLGTNVNCANCGNTCINGKTCINGNCACPPGLAVCGDHCCPPGLCNPFGGCCQPEQSCGSNLCCLPCQTCGNGGCRDCDGSPPRCETCKNGICVAGTDCWGVCCGDCQTCDLVDGTCRNCNCAETCQDGNCVPNPGNKLCGHNICCDDCQTCDYTSGTGTCRSCNCAETCQDGNCVPVPGAKFCGGDVCCGDCQICDAGSCRNCNCAETCQDGNCVPVLGAKLCGDACCGDCQTCDSGNCRNCDSSSPYCETCEAGNCVTSGADCWGACCGDCQECDPNTRTCQNCPSCTTCQNGTCYPLPDGYPCAGYGYCDYGGSVCTCGNESIFPAQLNQGFTCCHDSSTGVYTVCPPDKHVCCMGKCATSC
jgi:hypothetical protein